MEKLITIGQIIDKTFDIYRDKFKPIMQITLWLFLSSIVFIVGIILAPVGDTSFLAEQNLLTGSQITGMFLANFGTSLITLIITLWIFISIMLIISNSSKTIPVKTVQKMAWKKFWPFAGVSILRALIQSAPLLALLPGIVLIFVNIFTGGSLVLGGLSLFITFIGLVVGLVFAVLFMAQFAFPGFENVLGEKSIIASLMGSRALVKGRFWATFVRLMIPKILFAFISVAIQVVLVILVVFFLSSIPALVDTAAYYKISSILQQILTIGVTALTAPLFLIADYLVYESLRKNK